MDRIILCALALLVLAVGGWTLAKELEFGASGLTSVQRLDQKPVELTIPGLSLHTRQQALMDCAYTVQRLGSLEMRYQTDAFRSDLPDRCHKLALAAVSTMPTYSYGWLVAAMSAAASADWADVNDHLYRSQLTGRESQWIAEMRVTLAESHRAQLDERTRIGNDRDLQLLVRSQRGVGTIARRYISDPAFRDRITAIVETMPDDVQLRFVGSLRYLTR